MILFNDCTRFVVESIGTPSLFAVFISSETGAGYIEIKKTEELKNADEYF